MRWLYAVLAVVAAAALVAVAAIALTRSGSARHRLAAPPARQPSAAHRHHQTGRASSAPPRPASSAPPSPVPSPATPGTPGTPGQAGTPPPAPGSNGPGLLPAGFYWYHDPTRFSIAVPPGWQVTRQGHLVYVRDPGSGRFLIIDQTSHPRPDPLADWRQQEASRRGTYPGYHLIRLQAVRYAQAERAADWEFTYHHDGQLVHVLNRNILANVHHAYALYWSTPASEWQASFRFFRAFAATFRPAGMTQGS